MALREPVNPEAVEGLPPVAADVEAVLRRHLDHIFVTQFPYSAADCAHGQLELYSEAAAADRPACLSTAAGNLHINAKCTMAQGFKGFSFDAKTMTGTHHVVAPSPVFAIYNTQRYLRFLFRHYVLI